MVLYKKTSVTAKKGINFIRSAVEDAGSLFHKIEGENDLGIDALIELIRDEVPLNHQIAVQIKSGASYYNSAGEECLIPVEGHREYWLHHPLPFLGIVFVPSLGRAHWIDIKTYLKENPGKAVIRYQTSEANRFDSSTFGRIFVQTILREIPDLTLLEGIQLFRSSKPDESYLGLITLFRRYPNSESTWNELVQALRDWPLEDIRDVMVYFFAHISWHPDIWHTGESITERTKEHARKLFASFGRLEIEKLLTFVDEGAGIARGTIGQSVEAIISALPNATQCLTEIIADVNLLPFTRECAALILAMNNGKSSVPTISILAKSGSWFAQELIDHLGRYGEVNPYA
ncbi:DUF4365 domain-containing protein [Aeromonas caviae]|uniref:DUF4365 domain-containing protein n=1 Tax=Aeromonas caviae TaxID=648 RepID=UPI0029D60ECA|nr:DUF4365 domain-containing protein [Aeromonas caviae]MDX7859099.1 DUF4365 domain-containing protein [Aeromonas caviae]